MTFSLSIRPFESPEITSLPLSRTYPLSACQGEVLNPDREWLAKTLGEKIASIDWKQAAVDVERFLKPLEQKSLSLWNERYFYQQTGKTEIQ